MESEFSTEKVSERFEKIYKVVTSKVYFLERSVYILYMIIEIIVR